MSAQGRPGVGLGMQGGASDPAHAPGGEGIVVSGVTVTYRNGHTALRDASFAIPRGTVTALVGVNGSGKSTLFKAIMGFVRLGAGQIRILGGTVKEALRSNRVAYVPQAEEVDWTFPVLVEDVVMMGRYGHMGFLRRAGPADRAAVAAALDRVGMGEFRQRQIGELSGGQRKRVFLARALAQDAQVILLDEPFTGVDVKTEDAIVALLGALRAEGRVMLVATHNLGSVPEYCDRVVLVRGTVLAHGPTATTFTAANLERTFGGVLRHFVLPDEAGQPRRILTDDERPLVFHGEAHAPRPQSDEEGREVSGNASDTAAGEGPGAGASAAVPRGADPAPRAGPEGEPGAGSATREPHGPARDPSSERPGQGAAEREAAGRPRDPGPEPGHARQLGSARGKAATGAPAQGGPGGRPFDSGPEQDVSRAPAPAMGATTDAPGTAQGGPVGRPRDPGPEPGDARTPGQEMGEAAADAANPGPGRAPGPEGGR